MSVRRTLFALLSAVVVGALSAAGGLSGVASAQAAPELVVDRAHVITPQIAGYGGQLNGRVYAAISHGVGVNDDNVQELQRKFAALQPQIVRVFVNAADLSDPDRRASLARALL